MIGHVDSVPGLVELVLQIRVVEILKGVEFCKTSAQPVDRTPSVQNARGIVATKVTYFGVKSTNVRTCAGALGRDRTVRVGRRSVVWLHACRLGKHARADGLENRIFVRTAESRGPPAESR
eukprot:scaffold98346_cov63-Phaeocystis_antarctica.AAC.1